MHCTYRLLQVLLSGVSGKRLYMHIIIRTLYSLFLFAKIRQRMISVFELQITNIYMLLYYIIMFAVDPEHY